MKIWTRVLALTLALLMGAVALAEDMTLPEKLAAAEEEVLQWFDGGGEAAQEDARRAVEYLLERGEALFAGEAEWTDEEAVAAAQAVTYLEKLCENVSIAIDSPVVRLCSAMRTAVELLFKQELSWEDSGVGSYAIAFESARDELNADMDAHLAALLASGEDAQADPAA